MRYQTEIFVVHDRYVCLQLPDFFPEGRATVTVTVEAGPDSGNRSTHDDSPDHEDIEWWDEFDEDERRTR